MVCMGRTCLLNGTSMPGDTPAGKARRAHGRTTPRHQTTASLVRLAAGKDCRPSLSDQQHHPGADGGGDDRAGQSIGRDPEEARSPRMSATAIRRSRRGQDGGTAVAFRPCRRAACGRGRADVAGVPEEREGMIGFDRWVSLRSTHPTCFAAHNPSRALIVFVGAPLAGAAGPLALRGREGRRG